MLAEESEFQRIFDEGAPELELKLMRDQYEVLQASGPLLLAGSAGSGKTTITVHRLCADLAREIERDHQLPPKAARATAVTADQRRLF